MARANVLESSETALCAPGCGGPIVPASLSEAQATEYAEWFKAISDPTRIRILNLLACNPEPVCVCDIVEQFPLGQPTISHHLKILRDTRFVVSERRGSYIMYTVNRNCIREFPAAARLIMAV